MSHYIGVGRDPAEGTVYLYGPSVERSGGPERIATEVPPDDWTPPPFLGFTTPAKAEQEPVLWDGDGA